jgi:hypothetical protein
MVAENTPLGASRADLVAARVYRMFYDVPDWDRPWSHWVCSEPMADWLAMQFGAPRDLRRPSALLGALLGLPVLLRNDPGGLRLELGPRRRF